MDQAVTRIGEYLRGGQHQICTPNPEMLVEASRNEEFLDVLRASSLNIPDGTGLLWAAKRCGSELPERVTGTDLLERIAALPDVGSVFFLGAGEGVAERAADALKSRRPTLWVAGTYAGSPREADASDILRRINESGARVLFVAYGAPAQELWIHRYLSALPNVRVAVGVGGAFDFLAGTQKRAPKILRSLGLEWFWRLLLQPSRLPRIFTAVVRFPLLVLRYRSASPLRAASPSS